MLCTRRLRPVSIQIWEAGGGEGGRPKRKLVIFHVDVTRVGWGFILAAVWGVFFGLIFGWLIWGE